MTKTGIIGAMHEEVVELIALLEDKKSTKIAGLEVFEGKIHGKDVAVVECGIAKVNAAMCTQILISEFKVDRIINTGVAGALYRDLKINDLVVSCDAIQYDVDASALGDPAGTIPRMKTSVFVADTELVEIAKSAYENMDEDNTMYVGRVVTGDRFVSEKEMKNTLAEKFNGYCCEMEGGAIAHVAYQNGVPFVIIRAISDNADNSAELNYSEFVNIAAETSKKLVLNMLDKIK